MTTNNHPAPEPEPTNLFSKVRVDGEIPIDVATRILSMLGHRQVIIVTWDGTREHVVTQGQTLGDADMAAEGGNLVKKTLAWPDSLRARSARMEEFQRRVRELVDTVKDADVMPDQSVRVRNALLAVEEALQPGWGC